MSINCLVGHTGVAPATRTFQAFRVSFPMKVTLLSDKNDDGMDTSADEKVECSFCRIFLGPYRISSSLRIKPRKRTHEVFQTWSLGSPKADVLKNSVITPQKHFFVVQV